MNSVSLYVLVDDSMVIGKVFILYLVFIVYFELIVIYFIK